MLEMDNYKKEDESKLRPSRVGSSNAPGVKKKQAKRACLR